MQCYHIGQSEIQSFREDFIVDEFMSGFTETSSLQLATYSSPLQESEVLTETQALCRSIARPGHRRTRVPDRPNSSLNLWSIMKNCIGKELSKIPMPVSVVP